MTSLEKGLRHVIEQIERRTGGQVLQFASLPGSPEVIEQLLIALEGLEARYQRSLDQIERRADNTAMLDRIITTINQTLDLQVVLDTSLREALRAVQWDAGAIYMWDERAEILNMVSYVGLSEEYIRTHITFKLGEGIVGAAAQANMVIAGSDESYEEMSLRRLSQVSFPLMVGAGQMVGILSVANFGDKQLPEDETHLLKTVSGQIALALDKAQLYTRVSEHAEELEGLVAARTEQLSQAIDELWLALKQAKEADRIKSLLLSTVSHELRTPLATIKGNTSLLIEHHRRIPREQWLEHLQDIEDETDKLTELISNLLDMSRVEGGMLQIEAQPVDIVAAVGEIVKAARIRFKERTVTFDYADEALLCMGDVRRIDQIVANLIDNAVKYSEVAMPVQVRVQRQGKMAVVSVIDRGKGIAPEYLEKIFDRFFQIKATSDSGRQGIGLGLAICRGLVEAQGGQIWAKSEPGRGSTFQFSLPLKNSKSGEEAQ